MENILCDRYYRTNTLENIFALHKNGWDTVDVLGRRIAFGVIWLSTNCLTLLWQRSCFREWSVGAAASHLSRGRDLTQTDQKGQLCLEIPPRPCASGLRQEDAAHAIISPAQCLSLHEWRCDGTGKLIQWQITAPFFFFFLQIFAFL